MNRIFYINFGFVIGSIITIIITNLNGFSLGMIVAASITCVGLYLEDYWM